ncbi:hypothetical protein BKI51_02590 [Alphaproteobacteria bacterium AO1-B]|nr:hypothetical protein BKI51_02590 [Alphaproteobacteria bacterium AO1-B]
MTVKGLSALYLATLEQGFVFFKLSALIFFARAIDRTTGTKRNSKKFSFFSSYLLHIIRARLNTPPHPYKGAAFLLGATFAVVDPEVSSAGLERS